MLLAAAADLAVSVARAAARDPLADPPPTVIQPILGWRKGTRIVAARQAALAALDDDAFRGAVADAAVADPSALDRPSWLYVFRPGGWVEELEVWRAAARVDELAAQLAAAASAAEVARGQSAQLSAELADERVGRAALARALDAANAEVSSLRDELERTRDERDAKVLERQQAVRDLKQTERQLADRTAALRAATDRLAELNAGGRTGDPSGDRSVPTESDHALVEMAGVAARQRELLSELVAILGRAGVDVSPEGPGPIMYDPGPGETRPRRPDGKERRRPIPIRRGLRADEPEGARWLLERPGIVALVDGYNVTKTVWPELGLGEQRAALERGAATLATATGASFVLVFDGVEAGAGRPRRARTSGVRVRFTEVDVEADDAILAMVDDVETFRPVAVVSSDQRVVRGAKRRGANTVDSATFAALLTGRSSDSP